MELSAPSGVEVYVARSGELFVDLRADLDRHQLVALASLLAEYRDVFRTSKIALLHPEGAGSSARGEQMRQTIAHHLTRWMIDVELAASPPADLRALHHDLADVRMTLDRPDEGIGIITVVGAYPDGSNGSDLGTAMYHRAYGAIEGHDLEGLVWDLSDFTYDWGDELDLYVGRFAYVDPALAIVTRRPSPGLLNIVDDAHLFPDVETAVRFVRQKRVEREPA